MTRFSQLEEKFRSDLKISRSSSVSFPEIAETSRTCAPKLVPKLVHNFIAIFHPELPWVAVAQSANPST